MSRNAARTNNTQLQWRANPKEKTRHTERTVYTHCASSMSEEQSNEAKLDMLDADTEGRQRQRQRQRQYMYCTEYSSTSRANTSRVLRRAECPAAYDSEGAESSDASVS